MSFGSKYIHPGVYAFHFSFTISYLLIIVLGLFSNCNHFSWNAMQSMVCLLILSRLLHSDVQLLNSAQTPFQPWKCSKSLWAIEQSLASAFQRPAVTPQFPCLVGFQMFPMRALPCAYIQTSEGWAGAQQDISGPQVFITTAVKTYPAPCN